MQFADSATFHPNEDENQTFLEVFQSFHDCTFDECKQDIYGPGC
jgi:hypothetical protein